LLGRSVVGVVVVAMVACGGTSDGDEGEEGRADGEGAAATEEPATTEATAPFEVEVVSETFVDTERPTPAGEATPAEPERTLVTRLAFPAEGGPYPLIVLSHGLTGHPDEYTETVPMWASDGFVVASPRFPLTNREAPGASGNVADVANQPGDVSFVIDQVLAANDDPASPLHGRVDPEAIGVVGHSLGAATTWAVSFDTATRDDRVDSTVIFAGLTLPMEGGELELDSGIPLLVLHGDEDDVPIGADLAAYEQAVSPKWFVTLHGARHVPPFTDAESPHDELVTRTVLDFWHGTLDGDAEALDRVTPDATDPDLTSVLHE
jgi:dienelactone hydrolase